MTESIAVRSLREAAPELSQVLARSILLTPPQFAVSAIRCETQMIAMRDGVRLATDNYRPPVSPAPAIAVRLPYGRGTDSFAGVFLSMARRGYVVVSQDCRGTGDSEPGRWDYYMYEPEAGYDLIEWIVQQPWFDGFLGSCGASYVGQTQWPMALHPQMTTIVPDVSGLGIAVNTVHLHMFVNAYARSVGKGDAKVSVPYYLLEGEMIEETLAGGYFNEPLYTPLPETLLERFSNLRGMPPLQAQAWAWQHYCALTCAERSAFIKLALNIDQITAIDVEALPAIFGQRISHDRHSLPRANPAELCRSICAPVLMRTGWYDWGLNDALATWDLLMSATLDPIRAQCRLVIGPNAHNMPGYHEG